MHDLTISPPENTPIWNAENYCLNSSIQFEGANKLLKQTNFRGDESILDIGSGDGKVTAEISSYIPKGKVIGIDSSDEMIQYANRKFCSSDFPNISFSLQNAEKLNYESEFDVIFSSFALHWVKDLASFMKRAQRALKNGGKIAFIIPLGISSPLEQVTEEIIKDPVWRSLFLEYSSPWEFLDVSEYKKMITNAGFEIISFELMHHTKPFDSIKSFKNYIFQWYPCINYVDYELREKFFNEVVDRYLEIEPCCPDGKVNFVFPRIDVIAVKKTLEPNFK